MKIGSVLRKYRIHTEITIRQLAKEIGITEASLLRIESGKNIEIKSWMKIIKWLFD